MNGSGYPRCDGRNSCAYFVSIPGGDSLLCKPYRKEQFYQIGYLSSSSSSCSSLQAMYCRETINTLSAIVYEESDSCTCHIPACFTCPRHQCPPLVPSTASCTECNTCSYICDPPRRPRLSPEICRLAELVDVSSSMSDLLAKIKKSKERSNAKEERKHMCECRPIQSICLKTVLKKTPCEECPIREIKPSITCHSNGNALICSPCKRILKFDTQPPTCREKDEVCPGNIEKDVHINLLVNVQKEAECPPARRHKKCKCKERKRKKEAETRLCKCNISPPIVICDKKPEKNKNFLETIKTMIASKHEKQQISKCACKKAPRNEIYTVTVCTDDKEGHRQGRKLSNIVEPPSKPKPNGSIKSNDSQSRHSRRSSNREPLAKSVKPPTKQKNGFTHSKDQRSIEGSYDQRSIEGSKDQRSIEQQLHREKDAPKPENERKASRRSARISTQSQLNTLYMSRNSSSTERSTIMNPEETTIQYMFVETYERYPLRATHCGLQKVTYNVKLSYKSILWLSLSNLNDMLKFKKPSARTAQTKWKPLETTSSFTEMNTNDKFTQATGIVEQCLDDDKNFLSIVKKFEKYKNQQRVLEDMKERMSDSYHKGSTGNIVRQVIRRKRRVFFTKIKSEYLCRIFCDYIGPLIYFFYLVVFFWVTF